MVGVGESLGIREVSQKEREIKCNLRESVSVLPNCVSFVELDCQGGNNGDSVLIKSCRDQCEFIVESVGMVRDNKVVVGVVNKSSESISLPQGQLCVAEEVEIIEPAVENKAQGHVGAIVTNTGMDRNISYIIICLKIVELQR